MRRRWIVVGIALAVVAVGLLAALFVPISSRSQEINVTSAGGSSTALSLPSSVWVTVHFAHAGGMAMTYGMDAPGGGMMFTHTGRGGSDSYSFWSNGGSYHCWAGYTEGGFGMTPVWVNASWGLI